MVAPITGPIVTQTSGTPDTRAFTRTQWRQAKPIDRPLPYSHCICSVGRTPDTYSAPGFDAGSMGGHWDVLGQISGWDSDLTHLNNRLYDRFKGNLSDRASLGAALAEIGQSWDMVTGRALQLAKFARHLRRFDFSGAARTLRMSSIPKGVSTKKSFANNYLEFHFGWSPMIGDIYDAVDVLQNPIKDVRVRAGASLAYKRYDLSAPTAGYNLSLSPYRWETFRYWAGIRSARCGAEVRISNPNLWLANQLGLVNPVSVAWEVIPFSFVMDWFANVGQVIESMTDFYGLTLSKEWTTYRFRGVTANKFYGDYKWSGYETRNGVFGLYTYYWTVNRYAAGPLIHVRRRSGLPKPTFVLKPWSPWKWRRTAAAVSLLIQQTGRRP